MCSAPARLGSGALLWLKAAPRRHGPALKACGVAAAAAAVALRTQLVLAAAAAGSAASLALAAPLAAWLAVGAPFRRYPYAAPSRREGVAVLAGSFNPPHLGHLQMLTHLAAAHETVYAVIGVNPSKRYAVSAYERQEGSERRPRLDWSGIDALVRKSNDNESLQLAWDAVLSQLELELLGRKPSPSSWLTVLCGYFNLTPETYRHPSAALAEAVRAARDLEEASGPEAEHVEGERVDVVAVGGVDGEVDLCKELGHVAERRPKLTSSRLWLVAGWCELARSFSPGGRAAPRRAALLAGGWCCLAAARRADPGDPRPVQLLQGAAGGGGLPGPGRAGGTSSPSGPARRGYPTSPSLHEAMRSFFPQIDQVVDNPDAKVGCDHKKEAEHKYPVKQQVRNLSSGRLVDIELIWNVAHRWSPSGWQAPGSKASHAPSNMTRQVLRDLAGRVRGGLARLRVLVFQICTTEALTLLQGPTFIFSYMKHLDDNPSTLLPHLVFAVLFEWQGWQSTGTRGLLITESSGRGFRTGEDDSLLEFDLTGSSGQGGGRSRCSPLFPLGFWRRAPGEDPRGRPAPPRGAAARPPHGGAGPRLLRAADAGGPEMDRPRPC
ncbi:unnamed protein product [Prorocentrum cordatum]|uniref:Cytidyltransferase-like domain-containing protein n=1 Tax=Prorocentrum cordatum TaxID=2364126 RepID=A0ABN9XEU7_9DINO|nr:unnamed protein product [Polarella glacialis]